MANPETSFAGRSAGTITHHRMPDFMIIGAAKSGTTSLASRLARHPQIFMGPKKEYEFFSHDENFVRGVDVYSQNFEKARLNQLCMDASTSYTRQPQYPNTAKRIYRYCPDAKFIYMMRHPVDRAYSQYIHRFTKELYPGRPIDRTFEEHVTTDPLCLDSSQYQFQIEQYFEYFPKKSFLFLFTHEYGIDEERILNQVCKFLDITPDPAIFAHQGIKNNSFNGFRERRVRKKFADAIKSIPMMTYLIYLFPKRTRELFYQSFRKIGMGRQIEKELTPPSMKRKTRLSLLKSYKPSNDWVAELTGTDLSCWNE